MNRILPKTPPALYAGIIASILLVFWADLHTPLGVAIWIVYLVPVVLCLFVWKPNIPIIVAAVVTVLIGITFVTDSAGISRDIVQINRGLGLFTVWSMAYACHQSIRNKITLRRLEWNQRGLAALNERMVGDKGVKDLGASVLSFLAEYLAASVGAFFVEGSDGFDRTATFAVPDETDVPRNITPGQGLIGQAIADRRSYIIESVPDGYLRMGSSLGKSIPRSLAITPAIEDGKVLAVLELGFINPIDDLEKEFLDLAGESIAIAVRSAKVRSLLAALHDETQRQNEELQAQSEELRVSNEELEEQSRALKESQSRLENQQAELEQTNVQLEEQSNRLEHQRDELARAKSAIEEQAATLEKSSQYKSDFLANMSHELRTPLNSSLILAKLLGDNREGNLTADQVKYAQTIESAGNDLLTLINDILDLSKIEAGHMEARPDIVRLSSLCKGLNRTFAPLATAKNLEYKTAIQPDAPSEIVSDSGRLEQILKNLIANAIKFTESGSVTLSIFAVGSDSVKFSVVDTGIGIADNQLSIIFDAFKQADSTTSRRFGGTGLGLSISRQLARLLGGKIEVTSTMGSGSTFSLLLPRVLVNTPPIAEVQPIEIAPLPWVVSTTPVKREVITPSAADDREFAEHSARTVLVIEDDVSFSKILLDLAHEFDFRCLIAGTAAEGLALATEFLPAAIILDLGLPDSTGLSVLDRLKQNGRTRHIPVHIVSGSDYVQTALSLGAVAYMMKPVNRDDLVQAFQQLERRLTQRMRRVLIVEDDLVQLDSLRLLLGTGDVDAIGAQTAAQCLELLKSNTFDCMVMDLSLPDSSGFVLLETLSREDRYSFPPVIVYTGRDLTPNEEQQLRKYSQSIIVKGAKSPERLLDEVTLFLHQVVSDLPERQQKMLQTLHSRDESLQNRRILVAEDDVRNVFALTSILEPLGANVVIARNGKEALDVLETEGPGRSNTIDLVLMDIMMPEMDGFTAMREIRKRPEWSKLPIIALTAKAMKNDQEECISAGANDYMAKPIDVEKLLSLVRVWLPR